MKFNKVEYQVTKDVKVFFCFTFDCRFKSFSSLPLRYVNKFINHNELINNDSIGLRLGVSSDIFIYSKMKQNVNMNSFKTYFFSINSSFSFDSIFFNFIDLNLVYNNK